MSVTLSIKNVPDEIAEALRKRAAQHHRSIQGELLDILETSVRQTRPLTACQLLEQVRASGLSMPEEAAAMVRADRDAG